MASDAGAGAPRAAGGAGWIRPVHQSLPLLAEERFAAPLQAHRLVTFLNRALKGRGLVFGLTQDGEEARIRIYASDGEPDPRREGDRVGTEHDPDHPA